MKKSISQVLSGTFLAVALIPTTWLFFGPIAGFHHMYGFGITFYLMLNGEDPQPGDYMWGEYAVRFFPGRFAVGLLLWLISVFILFKLVRLLIRRRYATTLLAILALSLGCVGCQQKRAAIQQAAIPAPEPGERPSFYDSNNVGEYYGRCPKCQHWVKGYLSNVTFVDNNKSGELTCEPRVTGSCQYCKMFLFTYESDSLTNESRMVQWMPPVETTTEHMRLLDNGAIGLLATNASPFALPK